MTNNNHLITPPPELVKQWLAEFYGPESMPGMAPGEMVLHVAAVAARWGYEQRGADIQKARDEELEACCEWLDDFLWVVQPNHQVHPMVPKGAQLRDARRPKPLSLKEQALAVVENSEICDHLSIEHAAILRRALESLPDNIA